MEVARDYCSPPLKMLMTWMDFVLSVNILLFYFFEVMGRREILKKPLTQAIIELLVLGFSY